MNRITLLTLLALVIPALAICAEQRGSNSFLRDQAYAEMTKVSGQIDVLQNNQEELARRVDKLERGGSEAAQLKNDIQALRAEIESLRRSMAAMREEIVKDLLARINSVKSKPTPTSSTASTPPEGLVPYTVVKGDTLSLIAEAFGSTPAKLKEYNKLKSDRISIGQKILVPAVRKGK